MKIFIRDIDKLSNEDYAKARKNTFGASDVAVMFDLGFTTLDDLIAQKAIPELTKEELSIGDLPNVRKGRDLEPLIIQKFIDENDIQLEKPTNMYEIQPGLTVNYDAVHDNQIPYEIKYVTTFGHKNYNTKERDFTTAAPDKMYGASMKEHIAYMAKLAGIPAYYYTQLQTQIYGLDAKYGVLVALFEKDWTVRSYTIAADPFFRKALPIVAKQAYDKLLEAKGIKVEIEEDMSNYEY